MKILEERLGRADLEEALTAPVGDRVVDLVTV
jgi:hypothetical protein